MMPVHQIAALPYRSVTACVIGLVFSALLITSAAAEEKVTFRLDWKIYGAHAPFFLARERGYFAKAGLDVDIPEGQGAAAVAKLIASGTEEFGFLDFGTMIKAVEQGLPLKAVFGVFQRSPMVVIGRGDQTMHGPADLVGKLVAMAPDESTAQIFPALLAAAKIEPGAVSIVNPAVGAKSALFLQNRVDAITAFVNVQVPQLEAQGAKLNYFEFADYKVNTLSLGVVTNQDYLAKKPEVIRVFLAGVAKGWEAAKTDPDAAIDAMLKAYPEYKSQRAVLKRQLDLTLPLLETDHTKGNPVGWMSLADWEQTQKILVDYAGVKGGRPPQQYFTNDYVPQ